MGNQHSPKSGFTVNKFIKEINIDVGRKNFKQIICEPFYNKQVIDKLTCFLDLTIIYDQIKCKAGKRKSNLAIELSFYKFILRYTTFKPINFPAKLKTKFIQVIENISNKEDGDDHFVPNFESTIEALRKYLISETQDAMKAYWEEIHKDSPTIKRLSRNDL